MSAQSRCPFPACKNSSKRSGYCDSHLYQQRKTGRMYPVGLEYKGTSPIQAVIPPRAQGHYNALSEATKTNQKYIPCLQIEEVDWFSDDESERAEAADWCLGCPVLELCGAYAARAGERNGVWGGLDRTQEEEDAEGLSA